METPSCDEVVQDVYDVLTVWWTHFRYCLALAWPGREVAIAEPIGIWKTSFVCVGNCILGQAAMYVEQYRYRC